MLPIKTFALSATLALVSATAASAADDTLLQTIKDRGTMRVCEVDYAPWNNKNPATNTWEGVNVDIITEIANTLKVKLEHVDATWGTIIPSITTQKCDFAAAGLYISAPRAEIVTFTRTFATDGIALFVAKDSTAKTLEDLDKPGKVIVARSGAFEEGVARATFKHATVKALTADQMGIILLEVAAGRADAGAGGYFGNLAFLKANPNIKARVLNDELLSKTSIAYAVPAREYFFRDYLNISLQAMEENGKVKAALAHWTQ